MTERAERPIDPRQVTYLPLDDLSPDPRNPKAHDMETIDASIGRFGVLDLIVRDERTGYIVSGHGRAKAFAAMRARGESAPEGVRTDADGTWLVPVVTGWASRTDSEAAAALIAMNRTTELGGWVDEELLALLDDLAQDEGGLEGVGFAVSDIDALRERLTDLEGPQDTSDRVDGSAVGTESEKVDVLWGEPTHQVAHGDVWQVGRHLLVVARLSDEHDRWAPLLSGRVFCPYPEPYLTLSNLGREEDLLLVQPVAYLAGHVLDKHASIHPEDVYLLSRVAPPSQDDAEVGAEQDEVVEVMER